MKPRHPLQTRFALLLSLLLCMLMAPVLAQDPSESEQPAEVGETPASDSNADAPELDIADLLIRVEQVAPQIAGFRKLLNPIEGEPKLQRNLEELGLLMDELQAELDAGEGKLIEDNNSEQSLAARNLVNAITARDNALAARLEELLAALDQLQTAEQDWAEVNATLAAREVSEDLLNRVQSARDSIATAINDFQIRRDEILTLRNAVAQQWVRADALISEVESWRSKQFLVQTSPALWDSEFWQFAEREEISARLQQRTNLTLQFFFDIADSLVFLIPIGVVLLALSISLGHHARRRGQSNERLERAAETLTRPISMTILVMLLIIPSGDWPGPARACLAIIAILPFYRVLMTILPARAKWSVAPLILVLVMQLVRILLGAGGPVDRWLFLLVTLFLATILAISLYRNSQLLTKADASSMVWARLPMWALLGIAITAALAEAAGFTNASRSLGAGVSTGVFMAFICYAAYRYLSAITSVMLFSDRTQAFRAVYQNRVALQEFAWRIFSLGSYALWIYLVLDSFAIAENLLEPTRTILTAKLEVGSLGLSLGGILAFGTTLWVSFLLARAIPAILEEDIYTRLNMKRGVPYAISTFTRYGLIVLGLIAAISAAGVDLSQTLIVFGALGVGIGFGLQNVVNDFVAGGILLFERPIQVGDIIQIGTLGGRVSRIGARSSTIETWDGAEVILPNGQLTSAQLTNWTLSHRRRRVDIDVTVTHDANPKKVVGILVDVANAHEDVTKDPPPRALFLRFGENGAIFRLQAWTNEVGAFLGLQSDLNASISEALHEAGIHIPVFLENLRGAPAQS